MSTLDGVLNGHVNKYSLENCKHKFQLLIFYPGDFVKESQSLISQFSQVQESLLASDCKVYGVSRDSVNCHKEWLKSLTINPTIPLLSDTAGDLADKYGVPSPEEEAEPTTRCVVITDNMAVMLEIVSSSLDTEQLVKYCQEKVDMLVEKRKQAVERVKSRNTEKVELSLDMELMIGGLNGFTKSLVNQARRTRERSETRCKSNARSLSRSRLARRDTKPSSCADPIAEYQYKRQVDRLVKGFF